MRLKRSISFPVPLTKVRWIVAIVAIIAILLWGALKLEKLKRLSNHYGMMSHYCRNVESTYTKYRNDYIEELRLFENNKASKSSLNFLSLSPPGRERIFAVEGAARNQELAIKYGNLKKIYEEASIYPWVDIPEELRHPIWEREMGRQKHGDGEY
jgi:hypothetical protein